MAIGDLPILEKKESLKKRILEIGPHSTQSFFKQYGIEIPKESIYQGEHLDWSTLPDPENPQEEDLLPNVKTESVDEVFMSNVLSHTWLYTKDDLSGRQLEIYANILNARLGESMLEKGHWIGEWIGEEKAKIYNDMFATGIMPLDNENSWFGQLRADIDYVLKLRTLKTVKRILKHGGVLKFYENYYVFEPVSYEAVLKFLQSDPELSFTEDFEEEKRLQPMMDKVNKEYLDRLGRKMYPEMGEHLPRPHNHVYVITKK